MSSQLQQALNYVHNTNGGGSRESFLEDFEPIGELLWKELSECGLVAIGKDGVIELTLAGKAARGRG